ncbi:MAG: hypothetical protein JXB13_10750, partial [Phycisphaerae bacterium]|nr:hypothetical protein [Phycisphaerae bacterium]
LEQPTQKFADLTGEHFGFTILNNGRYGCDALGGRLRVTLLRNPNIPDRETDNGRHRIKLAFVPHGPDVSNDQLVRQGIVFNRPALSTVVSRARPTGTGESNVSIAGSSSVICTALRRAEHSDGYILRLFETSGLRRRVTVSVGRGLRKAQPVNFLERPMGGPCRVSRGKVTLTFRPYEVKSLLLSCGGWY